ncbi:hypothetical protein CLU79DRAFT_220980 [Phycomyces nitens]|nr:hypothetical protein CLU79DRAFT_220980 [Phycomyces nitens]
MDSDSSGYMVLLPDRILNISTPTDSDETENEHTAEDVPETPEIQIALPRVHKDFDEPSNSEEEEDEDDDEESSSSYNCTTPSQETDIEAPTSIDEGGSLLPSIIIDPQAQDDKEDQDTDKSHPSTIKRQLSKGIPKYDQSVQSPTPEGSLDPFTEVPNISDSSVLENQKETSSPEPQTNALHDEPEQPTGVSKDNGMNNNSLDLDSLTLTDTTKEISSTLKIIKRVTFNSVLTEHYQEDTHTEKTTWNSDLSQASENIALESESTFVSTHSHVKSTRDSNQFDKQISCGVKENVDISTQVDGTLYTTSEESIASLRLASDPLKASLVCDKETLSDTSPRISEEDPNEDSIPTANPSKELQNNSSEVIYTLENHGTLNNHPRIDKYKPGEDIGATYKIPEEPPSDSLDMIYTSDNDRTIDGCLEVEEDSCNDATDKIPEEPPSDSLDMAYTSDNDGTTDSHLEIAEDSFIESTDITDEVSAEPPCNSLEMLDAFDNEEYSNGSSMGLETSGDITDCEPSNGCSSIPEENSIQTGSLVNEMIEKPIEESQMLNSLEHSDNSPTRIEEDHIEDIATPDVVFEPQSRPLENVYPYDNTEYPNYFQSTVTDASTEHLFATEQVCQETRIEPLNMLYTCDDPRASSQPPNILDKETFEQLPGNDQLSKDPPNDPFSMVYTFDNPGASDQPSTILEEESAEHLLGIDQAPKESEKDLLSMVYTFNTEESAYQTPSICDNTTVEHLPGNYQVSKELPTYPLDMVYTFDNSLFEHDFLGAIEKGPLENIDIPIGVSEESSSQYMKDTQYTPSNEPEDQRHRIPEYNKASYIAEFNQNPTQENSLENPYADETMLSTFLSHGNNQLQDETLPMFQDSSLAAIETFLTMKASTDKTNQASKSTDSSLQEYESDSSSVEIIEKESLQPECVSINDYSSDENDISTIDVIFRKSQLQNQNTNTVDSEPPAIEKAVKSLTTRNTGKRINESSPLENVSLSENQAAYDVFISELDIDQILPTVPLDFYEKDELYMYALLRSVAPSSLEDYKNILLPANRISFVSNLNIDNYIKECILHYISNDMNGKVSSQTQSPSVTTISNNARRKLDMFWYLDNGKYKEAMDIFKSTKLDTNDATRAIHKFSKNLEALDIPRILTEPVFTNDTPIPHKKQKVSSDKTVYPDLSGFQMLMAEKDFQSSINEHRIKNMADKILKNGLNNKSIDEFVSLASTLEEHDMLCKYCWENPEPISKLFIMHESISKDLYGDVLILDAMIKKAVTEDTIKVDKTIYRCCNILANVAKGCIPRIVLDLPLEIFGRPPGRGKLPI